MDAKGNISEIEANAGISNTGNTFLNKVNTGLEALFTKYGLPLKNSDGTWDFNTLKAIDLSVIDEADFRYTLNEAGNCITDLAVQPYKKTTNLDGNVINLDGQVYNLKY